MAKLSDLTRAQLIERRKLLEKRQNLIQKNQQIPSQQPQQKPGILGRRFSPQETRQIVESRQDILSPSLRRAGGELKQQAQGGPLVGGISGRNALGVVGGLAQRAEAAVANPLLRIKERTRLTRPRFGELRQEGITQFLKEDLGQSIEDGKLVFNDILEGVTGKQLAQFGDVFRSFGLPDRVSATLGLATSVAVTNILSAGKIGSLARKAKGVVKPSVIKNAQNVGDKVITRLPGKPKIFGPKFLQQFTRNGRKVTEDLEDTLFNAFDDVITPVKGVRVNPDLVDDSLLKTFVTEADSIVLKEIDDILTSSFGSSRVDSIEKVRLLKQILRKRTPQQFYKGGGTTGKGGLASTKVRQVPLIKQLGNLEVKSLREAGRITEANQLRALNDLASQKVYPHLGDLRVVFGRQGTPIVGSQARLEKTLSLTGGLKGLFAPGGGPLARASERSLIKQTPVVTREIQKFITSGQYGDDLLSAVRGSRDLIKQMIQFRRRQLQKGGALLGGAELLRRKLGGQGSFGDTGVPAQGGGGGQF